VLPTQCPRHSDEAGRADARLPLDGLAVRVNYGFYMIGLSNMDADKGPQFAIAEGAGLVRYPIGLQQQPPRHPCHGKWLARRVRLRRCV
jgi:hypothetical protein